MLPLHSATRMLATPSATFQSPVGSAAKAGATKAGAKHVAKKNPEYVTVRMMSLACLNRNMDPVAVAVATRQLFRGQCNMV
jgi:hypothetical protein